MEVFYALSHGWDKLVVKYVIFDSFSSRSTECMAQGKEKDLVSLEHLTV